jgi:hypothetical protein
LVLEVTAPGTDPWIGNFQLGLTGYSTAVTHPNGQDLVVIAGGLGYIVRPHDRSLAVTFGGGVMGVWPASSANLLIFNDSGIAFRALGPDGWRWGTRRVSWDGIEGIEIAEKTIYGRGWNAVLQQWQPFSIEMATGALRGGAYVESNQQRIAIGRELTLRGGAPMSPLTKRVIESALGILALAIGFLTIYLVIESARTGELTWSKALDNWGVTYAGVFITAVVLVLGLRLIFPSLAPGRQLLTRSGIIAFFAVYFSLALIVFVRNGVIPTAAVVMVGAAVGGFAVRWWFRD